MDDKAAVEGERDQAPQQRAAPHPPPLLAIHARSGLRAHGAGLPGRRWRVVHCIGVQPSTSCVGAPCASTAMLGASAQLWYGAGEGSSHSSPIGVSHTLLLA